MRFKRVDAVLQHAKEQRWRTSIEMRIDSFQQDIIDDLTDYMRLVGEEWKRTHPKRRLRFYDAMGCTEWQVDGQSLTFYKPKAGFSNDGRLLQVFEPLESAKSFYCDIADQCNITIDEIEV